MTLDLDSCPFCGRDDMDGYRFSYSEGCGSPSGDIFRIDCRCGCRLDKHIDELVNRFVKENGMDIDCSEADLWDMMAEEWNERC